MAIIKFDLQGITRVITYDSSSYVPLDPRTLKGMGYFSTLSGAILKHLKDANVPKKDDHEEVIELKQYINRFQKLHDELKGLKHDDFMNMGTFVEIEKNALENNSDFVKRWIEQNINVGVEVPEKVKPINDLDEF